MIKCPSCSHENVDGTTFCEMCGEDLQSTGGAPAGATSSAVSAPVASAGSEIKCPACENMNPAENVVCEVCGTELRGGDDLDATSGADVAAPPVITPPPATTISDADTAQAVTTPAPDVAATPAAPDTSDPAIDSDAATATSGSAVITPPPGGATAPSAPVAPDVTAAPDTTATTPAPGGATAPAAVVPDTAAAATPGGAALAPGKVKLVVEQGMTVGKQFVLGDSELQVGREDEEEGIYPDIDLADQDEGYVHRKHATLKFQNDQLFVTHLGGANKTRLNNKPIPDNSPQPVALGDKIAFGKVVVRVQPL